MQVVLHVPDEIADAHVEGVRDQLECSQSHALLSAFQPVEMDSVQARKLGELILSVSTRLANFFDPFADNAMNVLQPIRLWVYAAFKHPALKQHGGGSR